MHRVLRQHRPRRARTLKYTRSPLRLVLDLVSPFVASPVPRSRGMKDDDASARPHESSVLTPKQKQMLFQGEAELMLKRSQVPQIGYAFRCFARLLMRRARASCTVSRTKRFGRWRGFAKGHVLTFGAVHTCAQSALSMRRSHTLVRLVSSNSCGPKCQDAFSEHSLKREHSVFHSATTGYHARELMAVGWAPILATARAPTALHSSPPPYQRALTPATLAQHSCGIVS